MPNITIHLDEETHQLAKVYAASHRTSISDLFREHIRTLTKSAGPVDVVASYAKGDLSAHDAMDALGLTCLEDLYSRTLSSGLELPRPSQAEAQRQATSLARLVVPARRHA